MCWAGACSPAEIQFLGVAHKTVLSQSSAKHDLILTAWLPQQVSDCGGGGEALLLSVTASLWCRPESPREPLLKWNAVYSVKRKMAFEEHKIIFLPEERDEIFFPPPQINPDWLIFLKCFRILISVWIDFFIITTSFIYSKWILYSLSPLWSSWWIWTWGGQKVFRMGSVEKQQQRLLGTG